MTENSDYFFWNLKELYPNFNRPSAIDEDIWAEMLTPYTKENIYAALKAYRKSEKGAYPPLPAQFKEHLYPYTKRVTVVDELPLSPSTYLMEEDIKAGRCKHFFPTYEEAVNYIFDVKLKEVLGMEEFAKLPSRGARYQKAVDLCLFADFDQVLDLVYQRGKSNAKR